MHPLVLAVSLASASVLAFTAPPSPGLSFLYSCNVSLSLAVELGGGHRTVFPILGGQFEGPNLIGKVLAVGADWAQLDDRGTFSSNARTQLQTLDQANIYVEMQGKNSTDGLIQVQATFETGHEQYLWLNTILGVGYLSISNNVMKPGYTVNLWQLAAPGNA